MTTQTILVVDDEHIFVRSVQNHLTRKNLKYKIKTAFNGREALYILKEEKVDLVILDINMPVVDGIQFLTELHNKKIWLPIIILTGVQIMAADQEVKIFREYGIVEYMEKPVDFDELNKKVEEVLNHFEIVKKPSSGIGIPTILRVIESEKRTGVLTVKFKEDPARIFFRDGDVIDAESKGLSAMAAFEKCLKPESEETNINIEYINHKRGKKITISFYEVLLDKSWLIDETDNQKKESKAAVTGIIFDELSSIPGFIGAAVYQWDGEIIDFKMKGKLNLQRLGRLGIELFESAADFSRKMNWGDADIVEIATKTTIFLFITIVPGDKGFGVVIKNKLNIGRIKLEISRVVKTLKKAYSR